MRYRGLVAFATSSLLAIAAPAMAQWSGQAGAQFNDFLAGHPVMREQLQADPSRLYDPAWRQQYPDLIQAMRDRPDVWSGLAAQSPDFYDARFREYLGNHPNVAHDLAADPGLLYDPNFVNSHRSLGEFLSRHGRPWRVFGAAFGGGSQVWGDYDESHQWHDYYWWHQNHPDWFWAHHPEWAANEPTWRDYDGDYDDSHVWHDRNWWASNHPDYVRQHHQDWGDWDDNHQWHDRDWWVQNRSNVVAGRHPNWVQQNQAYQQALKTEQIKAQQQSAAFAAQERHADQQAKQHEAVDMNAEKNADLATKKRQAYDQNLSKQADLNAQRREAVDQNAMKQADMRAEQEKMADQKRAAMEAQSHSNNAANNETNNQAMMQHRGPNGVANETEMHKMAPIHPGYANGEPAMNKSAPMAAGSNTPQNQAEMAQQNMKMRHGAEPAPQGAVHESKDLNNNGPGAVNH